MRVSRRYRRQGGSCRDRCNRRGKTSRACKLCVCCIRSKGDSFVERERKTEREMKKAIDVLASLSSTQARHPRKAERYTNVSSGMNARVCTCRYKKTRTCKLALSSIPPRCSLRCPCLEGFSLYKKWVESLQACERHGTDSSPILASREIDRGEDGGGGTARSLEPCNTCSNRVRPRSIIAP